MRNLNYNSDLICALGFSYRDTFAKIFKLFLPEAEDVLFEDPIVDFLSESKHYYVYAEGESIFTHSNLMVVFIRIDEFDLNYGLDHLSKDIKTITSNGCVFGSDMIHIFLLGALDREEPREFVKTTKVSDVTIVLHTINLNHNSNTCSTKLDVFLKFLNTGTYVLYTDDNVVDDLEENKFNLMSTVNEAFNEDLGVSYVDVFREDEDQKYIVSHEIEGDPINDIFYDRSWNSGYGQGMRDMYAKLISTLSESLSIEEISKYLKINRNEVERILHNKEMSERS